MSVVTQSRVILLSLVPSVHPIERSTPIVTHARDSYTIRKHLEKLTEGNDLEEGWGDGEDMYTA